MLCSIKSRKTNRDIGSGFSCQISSFIHFAVNTAQHVQLPRNKRFSFSLGRLSAPQGISFTIPEKGLRIFLITVIPVAHKPEQALLVQLKSFRV
jgi:hypothetical protein